MVLLILYIDYIRCCHPNHYFQLNHQRFVLNQRVLVTEVMFVLHDEHHDRLSCHCLLLVWMMLLFELMNRHVAVVMVEHRHMKQESLHC